MESPGSVNEQLVEDDARWMRRAIELAQRGEGCVEPNPMVGCVIVREGQLIGEGWHQRCGGPHAEIEALGGPDPAQRIDAAGATVYVTLEPCSHFGRTPPCADALIDAKVSRVVAAVEDPFKEVQGRGVRRLQDAGIDVQVGTLADEAASVLAPYLMRVREGRPWLIAKWAMTLDGKIATASGSSQWISNSASRREVHRLRARMDAIIVGSGTVLADDPQLTARSEAGGLFDRQPLRVVCDRRLRLPVESQLVATASEFPVLVATTEKGSASRMDALRERGCEVVVYPAEAMLPKLLADLGQRQLTNVLVEGGGGLVGALLEGGWIDEVWAFVAPKLVGGSQSPSPIGGRGVATMSAAIALEDIDLVHFEDNSQQDLLVRGRVRRVRSEMRI